LHYNWLFTRFKYKVWKHCMCLRICSYFTITSFGFHQWFAIEFELELVYGLQWILKIIVLLILTTLILYSSLINFTVSWIPAFRETLSSTDFIIDLSIKTRKTWSYNSQMSPIHKIFEYFTSECIMFLKLDI